MLFLTIFACNKTQENDTVFGNGDAGLFGGSQFGMLYLGLA